MMDYEAQYDAWRDDREAEWERPEDHREAEWYAEEEARMDRETTRCRTAAEDLEWDLANEADYNPDFNPEESDERRPSELAKRIIDEVLREGKWR